MKIVRLYMHNPLRNYNYIIGCEETRQAIALDPTDGEEVLLAAAREGFNIRLIINTHEHHDHIEGNPAVQSATGAPIWANKNAIGRIPNVDHGIEPYDIIELGTIKLKALPTPGHTPVHLCLLSEEGIEVGKGVYTKKVPVLFSGDTLFNACAGNCYNGGNVDDMYDSFVRELMPLSDETLLYPGHDYMKNNLAFALDREADNPDALEWQEKVADLEPDDMPYMTLGQERTYNPFLRLQETKIVEKLKSENPELAEQLDNNPREIFRMLRSCRDKW